MKTHATAKTPSTRWVNTRFPTNEKINFFGALFLKKNYRVRLWHHEQLHVQLFQYELVLQDYLVYDQSTKDVEEIFWWIAIFFLQTVNPMTVSLLTKMQRESPAQAIVA